MVLNAFSYLPLDTFSMLVAGTVGLMIGSYLNVAIYRIPAGISTVFPGSRCPRCLTAIGPLENIPVLSYLALRARCRACGGGISWRYPAIEAFTSFLFLSSYHLFPDSLPQMLVGFVVVSVFVVLGMIDWDHKQVPLTVVVPALVLSLGFQPFQISLLDSWLGAVGSVSALFVVSKLWQRIHGVEGFAAGDLWVVGWIGALWGWAGAVEIFVLAAFLGVFTTLWWALIRRKDADSLPFVTLLAASALLLRFVGPAWS